MIFFRRKKEDPMTVAELHASIINNVLFIRKMIPNISEEGRQIIYKQYGKSPEQLIDSMVKTGAEIKSIMDALDVEHLLDERTRKEFSDDMRKLNKKLLQLIEQYKV